MSASAAVATDRTANSSSFEITGTAGGRLEVRGALTFATARRAREEGLRALNPADAGGFQIDLGGVTAADSAGLAVLIDWLAHAKQAGRSLRFSNVPAGLRALARISDVDELLERGVEC